MHLYVLPTDLHNPYSPNILRSKGARKRGDLTTAIFIKAFPFSSSHIISPPSAKTSGRAAESGSIAYPQLCKSGAAHSAPFPFPPSPFNSI